MLNFEIDSSKKTSSEITSRFDHIFTPPLRLPSTFIIHSFYTMNLISNVNAYNCYFAVNDGTTAYTCSIPVGFYTSGSTLATAIQTALNALGSTLTYTVAISPLTNKMTISATGVFTLTISTAENARLMGFIVGSNTLAASYTGTNVANLNYVNYLTLEVPQLNVKTRLYVTAATSFLFEYKPNISLNLMTSPAATTNHALFMLTDEWERGWEFDYYLQAEIKTDPSK